MGGKELSIDDLLIRHVGIAEGDMKGVPEATTGVQSIEAFHTAHRCGVKPERSQIIKITALTEAEWHLRHNSSLPEGKTHSEEASARTAQFYGAGNSDDSLDGTSVTTTQPKPKPSEESDPYLEWKEE